MPSAGPLVEPQDLEQLQQWGKAHGPALASARERSGVAWLSLYQQVRQASEESAQGLIRTGGGTSGAGGDPRQKALPESLSYF